MKKLILVLAALVCSNQAFALSQNSSWEEILQAPNTRAAFPQIHFGNTFVAAFGVCLDGDNLRTLEKVSRCVAWKDEGENQRCARYEAEQLSTPRAQTVERCVEWKDEGETRTCSRSETYLSAIPVVYDVAVYGVRDYGEGQNEELLFTKAFQIEACR